MSDLIQTIEEDDPIAFDSDDSDVDEELTLVTNKQRQKKKLESKGFNSNFHFNDEGFSESQWSLESALHKVIKKKKMHSTLDQKIEEVRRKRITAAKNLQQHPSGVEEVVEDLELDVTDSEPEMDADMPVSIDKFRVMGKHRKKVKIGKKDVEISHEDTPLPLAEIKDSSGGEKSISWDPTISFQEMNLSRPLLKSISEMNYATPTPIQQAAIPIGLLGRDICACAATGTGKTAAFMLPVLERLLYRPRTTPVSRVLCILPTRELAVQVYSVTYQLAQHSSIRICLAAGGLDIKSQEAALRQSPDIIISTPGRLIDHLHNTPSFDLRLIEILILDEADRMLDEYFEEQMNEILKSCSHQRQTLLFSATMSEQVQELAAVSLKTPVKIFVNSNTDVAPFLRQEFIRIRPNREGDREAVVAALCSRSFISNVLVFTQTKKQAHRMHIVLGLLGIQAGELHGNLSQGERLESLKQFKNGEVDVLVCTDLAARGLDIENVKTVINLTMPNSHQHYVHRVGRTARAGRSGRSVSLVGESERKLLKEIIKVSKNPVKSRVVPSEVIAKFSDHLNEIEPEVGEVMKMEIQEKHIIASENQLIKAEKIINGEAPNKRVWFQDKIQREFSRAERMLGTHSMISKKSGKRLKMKQKFTNKNLKHHPSAENRIERELQKSKEFQSRQTKRSRKVKRARACTEAPPPKRTKTVKKRGSGFDVEVSGIGKKKSSFRRRKRTK